MEQVLKRPPWWAWFSLMGLEIPSAAIAWAFAVSQSHLVVVSSPWLYQFLFVAVWCVNMLDRVLKIFRGGSAVYTDECLLFAKKHCFVISLLIMVALVILCMFSRKRWSEEEDEDGKDSADRDMVSLVWMGVIVIYVVFCLAAAAREYTGDAWIYYGLAMAGAFMFVLDRLKMNMPPLLLHTLSWAALIFPLLLSGILAQASS